MEGGVRVGLAFYSPFYARENFIPLGKPGPTRTPFWQTLAPQRIAGVGKNEEKEL